MVLPRLSLRGIMILAVCSILTLVLGLNTFMNTQAFYEELSRAQGLRAKALAQAIVEDVARLGATMTIEDMAGLLSRHCYQLYQLNQADGITSLAVIEPDGRIIAHSDPGVPAGQSIDSPRLLAALGTREVVGLAEGPILHTLIPIGDPGGAVIDVGWIREGLDRAVRDLLTFSLVLFLASVLAASALIWWLLSKVFLQLETARKTAEDAAEAKSRFLANMSHDIRTPMNAILGLTRLALQTRLDPVQHGYLSKIQGAGQALLGILNDILDFSKIEAGKVDLESIPFLLAPVLEGVADIAGLQAAEKGLELTWSAAPDLPPALEGDPLRLGQVLVNLANNAVKFTERGQVALEAWLVSRSEGRAVIGFRVLDTGIGIPPEDQERLFSPFTQADSSTTRKYGGTGLGLAICRQLVGLMGGSIGVSSTVGAGSTFSFTLEFPVADEKALAPEAGAGRGPGLRFPGRRVLLVEDNAINQLVAQKLLEQAGLRVAIASDGRAAVEAVLEAAEPFDAVLMDVQMPGMDGFEATRLLRADPRYRGLPIIAMTARAMESERRLCLEAGMDDHLAKPIDPDRLQEALARWLPSASGPPPPVPAGAPEPAGGLPPVLAGIDRKEVLGRLGGDEALLVVLLVEFRKTWAGIHDRLGEAAARGDREEIQRAAHTLVGVGANLGMGDLVRAARELERELKAGGDPLPGLEALGREAAAVLAGLAFLDGAQDQGRKTREGG